jgi:hypothetical protein
MRVWYSHSALAVAFAVRIGAATNSAEAQTIRCEAMRSGNGYRGSCIQENATVGSITIRLPTGAEPHLWKGAIALAASDEPLVVDSRLHGTLRVGREWLQVSSLGIDSARFLLAFDRKLAAPATEVDAEIIRRTRAYLSAIERWSSRDSTDMDAAPVKGFNCTPTRARSVFCALYFSSVEVAGDYAHFRPAMTAVRQAIGLASHRQYRHPLVDFNNDSTRTHQDILNMLGSALSDIETQIRRGGA